jgi:hypothetical protein
LRVNSAMCDVVATARHGAAVVTIQH